MEEERKVYRVLMEISKERDHSERLKRRWEDGMGMNLREIGWGVWSGFVWLRRGTFGGLL
jgi:hypothetical protein